MTSPETHTPGRGRHDYGMSLHDAIKAVIAESTLKYAERSISDRRRSRSTWPITQRVGRDMPFPAAKTSCCRSNASAH